MRLIQELPQAFPASQTRQHSERGVQASFALVLDSVVLAMPVVGQTPTQASQTATMLAPFSVFMVESLGLSPPTQRLPISVSFGLGYRQASVSTQALVCRTVTDTLRAVCVAFSAFERHVDLVGEAR